MFNNNKKDYKFSIGGVTVATITGWQMFIPVVSDLSCGIPNQTCPGAQNGAANPYLVTSYANVLVTEVVPPRGLRLVGFENPRMLNETVTCKKGAVTVKRMITTLICSPCGDGIPCDNSSSSKSKLVK